MTGAQVAAYYLVVELISTAIPPATPPVIGPMPEDDCLALRLAMEAAAVPSIASIGCKQPVMRFCPFEGRHPSSGGYPCPVFDPSSFVGGAAPGRAGRS